MSMTDPTGSAGRGLSAIGAAPHLTRPNLPAPARRYPSGVNLTLVPFGEPALEHFLYLERPEGMACDGAWPAERVAAFRQWIDAGKPA